MITMMQQKLSYHRGEMHRLPGTISHLLLQFKHYNFQFWYLLQKGSLEGFSPDVPS